VGCASASFTTTLTFGWVARRLFDAHVDELADAVMAAARRSSKVGASDPV
jgi:hypothetical protein